MIVMNRIPIENLEQMLAIHLRGYGEKCTSQWQAIDDVPQNHTLEIRNVAIEVPMPLNQNVLADALVNANLPWAEMQFQERIGKFPVNPGDTYKDWPYYRGNVERHIGADGLSRGLFSHTYAERFWPRKKWHVRNRHQAVGGDDLCRDRMGIRFRYGDLTDVIDLLKRDRETRQAYLPIFFPEDTGAHHGERIPCSIGYHFAIRDNTLHLSYLIRSCDLFRHFADDVYMAIRLGQHVAHTVDPGIAMGKFFMTIYSLHVFDHPAELQRLKMVAEKKS